MFDFLNLNFTRALSNLFLTQFKKKNPTKKNYKINLIFSKKISGWLGHLAWGGSGAQPPLLV